jgi:hypothetical protein
MRMKSVGEIGLKISSALREYFRYTGASAELEQRGAGSSRPDLAWVRRSKQKDGEGRSESQPAAGDNTANREDRIGS